ncbi:hypothetical protein SAZ11_08285 [Streptomyces sp. FXJ1.4098]|nr:hypothetical protein [Streptomyces sp. FXJ1.4098]
MPLQQTTNEVIAEGDPATWKVIARLRRSRDELAREAGEALHELSMTPLGAPFVDKLQERNALLSPEPGIWVVQIPGITLPSPDDDREDWSVHQRLSVALVHSLRGTVQSTINLGDGGYIAGCGDTGTCAATVVAGDTAYIATDLDGYGKANEIRAFNLRTGKLIHTYKTPEASTWVPMRADGKALIAIQQPSILKPACVLRLDPDTGKATTLLRIPNDTQGTTSLIALIDKDAKDQVIYEDGGLFLHRSSGYVASRREDPIPMTLAYTAR